MLTTICNLVAGITLFFFSIHYICYIVQALSHLNHRTRSIGMQSEDATYIKKYVSMLEVIKVNAIEI